MGKRSKTTQVLLTILEGAVDSGILLYDFANNPHHYAYGTPNLDRYSLYHIVHRLKEKGWVETSRNEGKILVKLSLKGKRQLEMEKMLSNNDWDGKWRVVVFDIPEKYRKVRDVFRRRLKEWGFKHMQKSVWMSKKDISEPLREFVKELGIEKWVSVLVCTDIGD